MPHYSPAERDATLLDAYLERLRPRGTQEELVRAREDFRAASREACRGLSNTGTRTDRQKEYENALLKHLPCGGLISDLVLPPPVSQADKLEALQARKQKNAQDLADLERRRAALLKEGERIERLLVKAMRPPAVSKTRARGYRSDPAAKYAEEPINPPLVGSYVFDEVRGEMVKFTG